MSNMHVHACACVCMSKHNAIRVGFILKAKITLQLLYLLTKNN